jgi:hypothetical protein
MSRARRLVARIAFTRIAVASLALAALLAGSSSAQVLGILEVNEQRLQGTNPDGFLLLFAPDPVQLGSSVSHWDSSAFPNLLMEPAINADLGFLELDVTPAQMEDIGWPRGTSSFNVVNLDPPGVGFTDPTPFGGAPGNPADTLGEARINVFNAVLAAWANTLDSPVDVDVEVSWVPLTCDAGVGAVLAGAQSTFVFQGDELPIPGTWYHSALAESLAGENLTPDGNGDIIVFVNSDIDEGCLQPGTGFYYGLDGENPGNLIDLAPVVLHEVGHGLGFANFTTESSGQLFMGDPSIYDHFTFDTTLGRTWVEMTDAERVGSAVNSRRLVWNGARAADAAGDFLAPGVLELTVTSPAEVAGIYEVGRAAFGPPVPGGGLAGQIECMTDGVGTDPADTRTNGCSAATNPNELAGKIALIDRGLCNFTDKVLNAQAAGAIGAVIVNVAGNEPITLGGDATAPVSIPAVSLGRGDGGLLRQAACGDALFLNDGRFQVTAEWATAQDDSGLGVPALLTDETGYFYFFSPDNVELVVKVLNACNLPGFNNFWVFAAGLTNVEVTLTVTDTQTGQVKTYSNPLGRAFQPIQDTSAFATCP